MDPLLHQPTMPQQITSAIRVTSNPYGKKTGTLIQETFQGRSVEIVVPDAALDRLIGELIDIRRSLPPPPHPRH